MGLQMLRQAHVAVMEARTVDQLRDQVVGYARRLGFDRASAMTVIDHSKTHTDFHVVDNTPAGYSQVFHDPAFGRSDPVMQHCRRSSIPIVWDQETYVASDQGALWEHQAPYGYKTGVAVALHLPDDKHFFIGTDRDRPLPRSAKALTRIVGDLQLFAVHAQDAALRIFAPATTDASANTPSLTPRELEALRWTMDGKLAWEVGEALNISERTAVFHLTNATRKLGCNSKFQAVLKAMRLGLLT